MIKLENITFKYDKIIIDNINLNISKSKVTFIIGTNGSGKSTLASIISGLLYPISGKLSIDDLIINKKTDNKLIRNKVGIVFQNPSNQIIFSKVYDDLKFTLENIKIEKTLIPEIIKDSLKKVNMENFVNANPYELSGGEQQRIAIASQLTLNPDYLILDEATSMIDINGKQEIYKLISSLKKKMGIIFITNNMDELIYADEVVIIDNHKTYKYEINDILNNNTVLTNHHLQIPFIFKLATTLKINNIDDLNEKSILERINKND